MSILGPDGIAELEPLEAPLIDMANLKLGYSCSCDDPQNCSSPNCPSSKKNESNKKKSTPYPYFWRKTQLNPFVKSKNLSRRKIGGSFEILQPSKLKFIVGPTTSAVAASSSPSSTIGNGSNLLTTTLLAPLDGEDPNQIQGQQCTSASISNRSDNFSNVVRIQTSLRSSSTLQQQQLSTPSNVTVNGVYHVAGHVSSSTTTTTSRPGALTTLSLPVPGALSTVTRPDPNIESSLSLPDFALLSLTSDEVSSGGAVGPNSSHPTLTPVNQRSILETAVELRGALCHFKLDANSNFNSNFRSRKNSRTPKWKSRIRRSLKKQTLPPILEDSSESGFSGNNFNSPHHHCPTAPPSSPNLNCSQQALMETQSGSRWSQGGDRDMDSVDDVTIDELASYLDVFVYIPKKMSPMAEMMYT